MLGLLYEACKIMTTCILTVCCKEHVYVHCVAKHGQIKYLYDIIGGVASLRNVFSTLLLTFGVHAQRGLQ